MTLTLHLPDADLPNIREQQIAILRTGISCADAQARYRAHICGCFVYHNLDWYIEHRREFLGMI